MILLDGKATSVLFKKKISEDVDALKLAGKRVPHLAALLVGNNGASETYVAGKERTCKEIGFDFTVLRFDTTISESALLSQIYKLNTDDSIDGFIVQMPMPPHIDENKITAAVNPSKDVDGFHPVNTGRLMLQQPCFISATPKGILMLLEQYKIETEGKHCVVIGRSNIVGGPISVLMSRKTYPGNATVTLCHSATKNLEHYTQDADIIIAALGKPQFLKAEMVKEGAVVIDVGITRIEDPSKKSGYRIAGDVDFENVAPRCSFITPVPGGVGLMTIIGLLQNTLIAARKEIHF